MREFIKFLKEKKVYIGKFYRDIGQEAEFESLSDKDIEDLIKEFENLKKGVEI
jgi:hypothetical protein